MGRDHPSADLLARFLLGTTGPRENRAIVRHLLTQCPTCASHLRRLMPKPAVGAYDQALNRFTAETRRWAGRAEKRSLCSPRQPNLLSQL